MCGGQDCITLRREWDFDDATKDRIFVENTPPEVERFSVELIHKAEREHPRWLTFTGKSVRIAAENGTWVYRVTEKDREWVTGKLVHDEAGESSGG